VASARRSASDDVAISLVALARLRVAQARFADAERLVRDALAIRRGRDAGRTSALADTSTALGEGWWRRATTRAIAVLEDVVAARASEGDTPEHAACASS
jgi:hypothetical protein